jgi:hypothetical protein
MDMQLGIDHRSDRFKLGSKVLFEVLYFGVDGGMYFFIDDRNIGTELSHFLLGFCEIRVQGIEVSFQVLAMGVGHDEEGTRKRGEWDHTENGLWVKCITTIRATS